MKIGIYSRVSTDKQDTDVQLRDMRQAIESKGWTLVYEYVDTRVLRGYTICGIVMFSRL